MSLNAADVLARLTSLGHDTSILKQAYRSEVHGQTCTVFDPNSLNDGGEAAAVSIRADQVDYYVGKGFLVARPVAGKKGK